MGRLLARQALRFASGLLGAVLLAAALSALSTPAAETSALNFVSAMGAHLLAMVRLDFGLSEVSGWSAFGAVAEAMPYTAGLLAMSTVVALAIGVPLGLLLGTGPVRRAAAPLIQIVAAAPVFCASLALAWISARLFGVHPLPPAGGLFAGNAAQTLVLPVLTVGMAGAGAVQLSLHRAASQAQGQPWRATLRLMGLPAFEIERVYVAPQVFAGLFANLGDVMLAMVSAAAVVEWVFGWPGAAVLFVKSLALGDWDVAALLLLIFSTLKFGTDFVGALACDALIGAEAAA